MEERAAPDQSISGTSLGRGGQTNSESAAKSTHPQEGSGLSNKRLYRNPTDKKMMGVLSGFAAYFGGDVLWWRLGYAAIVLLSFAGSSYNFLWFLPGRYLYFNIHFWGIALIILYILLAILMPVAETPEDHLRMKGKEVNPQNLAEEIASLSPSSPRRGEGWNSPEGLSSGKEAPPMGGKATGRRATLGNAGRGASSHGCVAGTFGCIGGFFAAIWAVISTLFRWCIYACGIFLAGLCIFCIVCLTAVALNPIEWFHKGGTFMESQEFDALIPSMTMPFYIFVIAALLVLAITAYAIIHSLLNEFKQMPSMPYRQRIALLVMWILGLVAAGAACGYGWPKFIDAQNAWYRRARQEQRDEYTHDGIFIQPHEWDWLQKNGWRILNAEGCNDRFTAHGEYQTGDGDVRYLDCWDNNHRQRYRAERTDTLQPGTYRLTCIARANGTGACIYAIVGDDKPIFMEIPATGNEGGSIYEEAHQYLSGNRGKESIDREKTNEAMSLVNVHDGKGFGWNRIIIGPIRITKPTTLRYGLTSDDAFTGRTWLGQYFSATDFEISRTD